MRLAARLDRIEPFYVMECAKAAEALAASPACDPAAGGEPMIFLNIGEPDFTAPPQVIEAATRCLAEGRTQYTQATGDPRLREAIAGWYAARFGVAVDPARIVVTAGASAALQLACLALFEPGDEVLMPDPSYPCNRHFVAAAGATARLLPAGPGARFQLDAASVDRVASARFTYGAWMVANLHVRERPTSRGVGECWDNVLYDSPSLGYVSATHQLGRDQGQGVLTYYWPLATADADTGRQHLFDADYGTWRDAIVSDLRRAHRNLPDVLTRLDVFRWGHAMIQPRVGRLGADLRAGLTTALGGVHFAHSDLSGIAIFEEAFFHGTRAADEVVAALATQPAATAVEAG